MAYNPNKAQQEEHWLTTLLGNAYRDGRKSWPKKMKIYPSDLGFGGCPVGFWRSCRDYPKKDSSPGELLMWAQGSNLEDEVGRMLSKALAATGEWEVVEPPPGEQHRMFFAEKSGKLDFLLVHTSENRYLVLEVKSKRGGAFGYLNEIQHNNLIQTRFYIEGVCNKYDIADDDMESVTGMVVYVDREGQNFIRPFDCYRDAQSVLDSIAELEVLRDGPEPPPLDAELIRGVNKGPDSLSLKLPWQVGWCSQKECVCKKNIGSIPKGIICKQQDDGTLIPVKAAKKDGEKGQKKNDDLFALWAPVIEALLRKGADIR